MHKIIHVHMYVHIVYTCIQLFIVESGCMAAELLSALHHATIHTYTCTRKTIAHVMYSAWRTLTYMQSHLGLHLSARDFFSINLPLYRCR